MFTALEKTGLICLSILSYKLARTLVPWIYCNFLGPMLKPKIKFKSMGKWAGKSSQYLLILHTYKNAYMHTYIHGIYLFLSIMILKIF